MASCPTQKIVPTAKLSADNAGELELTSHCRVVAVAAAPQLPQNVPTTVASSSSSSSSSLPTSEASELSDHQATPAMDGAVPSPDVGPTRLTLGRTSTFNQATSTSTTPVQCVHTLHTVHGLRHFSFQLLPPGRH
jgi:hypothetical protein